MKEQRDGTRLCEIISPWASINNAHFHVGEPVKLTNNALSGVLRAFYESDEVITLFFCVTHKLKLIKIP